MRVAIVADDLTGALDTASPFVRHGLSVAVAVSPAGLAAAMQAGAEVVAVNTGSRELSEGEAVARIEETTAALADFGPDLVLKKIDSRLKGHVGAESAALARRFGLQRAVVAPAVPDQGRTTEGGRVVGTGVAVPIAIAPAFAPLAVTIEIADAAGDADLDAVAGRLESGTLAVGARGLGAALARRLGGPRLASLVDVRTPRLLMAIGSRDPITARQLDHLHRRFPEITMVEAVDGAVPAGLPDLPLALRCGGAVVDGKGGAVARRFAAGIAGLVGSMLPDCLWMTGGQTGLAILDALGVSLVKLVGEVAPGVPAIAGTLADGREMRCVLKSGGFGAVTVLEAAFDRGGTVSSATLSGVVTGGRV